MIRPILKYGAPELVRKSEAVTCFDEELKTLARDMLETVYSARGLGLAAPQVGVTHRLIVIDITGGEEQGHQLVFVNPQITEAQGTQRGEEGCLSIPGFSALVDRPQTVQLVAQDLDGKEVRMKGEGLLARVMCHEVDHVDGILYLHRISPVKREWIKRKIRKLVKAGEW